MRWPRSHRDGAVIEIRDDVARWRSDFDEPLPPVTRNELRHRLGLESDEVTSIQTAASRLSEVNAVAAA
jgi:hypothetical protein